MLPIITGEFTVVADPELRFTPSGAAVANIRLVANRKRKNDAGEWEDTATCWISGSIWREAAENVAESLTKGMNVFMTGELLTREFEDREGAKRQVWEVDVRAIGPSLKYQTAKVTKASRQGAGGGGAPARDDPWGAPPAGAQQQQQGQQQGGGAAADPWGSPPGGQNDEPPF